MSKTRSNSSSTVRRGASVDRPHSTSALVSSSSSPFSGSASSARDVSGVGASSACRSAFEDLASALAASRSSKTCFLDFFFDFAGFFAGFAKSVSSAVIDISGAVGSRTTPTSSTLGSSCSSVLIWKSWSSSWLRCRMPISFLACLCNLDVKGRELTMSCSSCMAMSSGSFLSTCGSRTERAMPKSSSPLSSSRGVGSCSIRRFFRGVASCSRSAEGATLLILLSDLLSCSFASSLEEGFSSSSDSPPAS